MCCVQRCLQTRGHPVWLHDPCPAGAHGSRCRGPALWVPCRTQIARVAGRSPLRASWVHSIAASERYVVLVEQPAYFNLLALLTGRLSSYTIFDW